MGAPQTSGDNLGDEKYTTLDKFYEIQQCAKIRMAKKKRKWEKGKVGNTGIRHSSHYLGKEGPQNEEMMQKTEAPYAYLKLEI